MCISYSIVFFITLHTLIGATPPAACFAKFRWEDCGKAPVPVMYYWRPGSRCEVGLWRGCLPNLNMFENEYECVATCIYTSRAAAEDYHAINVEEQDATESDVEVDVSTDNTTDATGVTEVVNATDVDVGSTTVGGADAGNGTVGGGATTAAAA